MAVTRLSAISKAPPDVVFDVWADIDRMRDWVGGVTGVEDVHGAPATAGTTYVVRFGPVRSPTTILEAERPRRYRSRFGSWILKGENDATFTAIEGGTRIDQEIRTVGWFSEITSRLFSMGSYKGSYQGELNEFAQLAEREAAARR